MWYRWESSVGSGEAEAAGHPGEYVEDNDGGASYAVNQAPEEVRHDGLPPPP